MALNLGSDSEEEEGSIGFQRDVRETSGVESQINAQLNMNSHKIVNVLNPTGAQDAATKAWVEANTILDISPGEGIDVSIVAQAATISGEDATASNKGIASFEANNFDVVNGQVTFATQGETLNMGTNLISNVIDPSGAQDAATKNYVDSIDHLKFKNVAADSGTTQVADSTTDTLTIQGGAGIDTVGVAGDIIQIAGEDSTAGNKGIIIVAAGEAINVSYVSGTATIECEIATSANKGVATFNTNNFAVTAGDVQIKANGIDQDEIQFSADFSANTHKITNLTDGAAAQDAAAFGQIAISSGTKYLSIPGSAFLSENPVTNDFYRDGNYLTSSETTAESYVAPVNLPHGAVVTAVIIQGTTTGENCTMARAEIDGDLEAGMSSAAMNTEDTTISNATINNQTYTYALRVASLGIAEPSSIWGARITYTI